MKKYYLTNKAYLSAVTVTSIFPSFTYKMAAKTSWHRYGTKWRHCHLMYTAADGRPLVAVATKLRALVLGGVHSTVASRANVFSDECLSLANCDPYHSIAKHCKMNSFIPDFTLHWLPQNILFSKVYASQMSEWTFKVALKLASVFHVRFNHPLLHCCPMNRHSDLCDDR